MTVRYITSELLTPHKHGFFTRQGGASSGIFHGLNCGAGSSDQADIVTINRARVAEAMDAGAKDLATVHQIHSAHAVVVTEGAKSTTQADAMVTNTQGVLLGILTADCQPVLFSDPVAGVVAAAHAGWRGALDGVLANTVTTMESLGATRGNIRAVIGPCISQPNYEVGAEFREAFIANDPTFEGYFIAGQAADKFQFDLPAFGLDMLRAAGLTQIAWTGHCTYADEARFYSYRRSCHKKEADYGRLISTIRL